MRPWEKYKVGKVSDDSKWTNNDCQELNVLYHVAHLETAERILKDGLCRAGLIFDKSKLNKERLLVNWLSPNTWIDGSRYGNIGFSIELQSIIDDMKYYWVEAITSYTPHACRILITDRNHDDILEKYDPTIGDGPWYYDRKSGTHYWNGKFTLELMLEKDIELQEFNSINFFDHHKNFCNIDHTTCQELNLDKARTGGRFVANILANNLPFCKQHFRFLKRGKFDPAPILVDGIYGIKLRIYRFQKEIDGEIKSTDEFAPIFMKAALNFLAIGDFSAFKAVVCLFYDGIQFEEALATLAKETFKLSSDRKLIDAD